MPPDCPPEPDLLAFHLGTLCDADVDRVAEHLETCTQCEAVVQRLETNVDPLLAALRIPVSGASDTFALISSRLRERDGAENGLPATSVWPELPGYEILSVLGRGGMGIVYQARQIRLNRLVALKRLRTTRPKDAARARVEAEALGRLHHPHIVQIHEVVEHEGRVYLALEFVEGGSLQARLTGKPQHHEQAAGLIELVARGVHHAHQNGIVHRDLKPANILLARGAQAFETKSANHGPPTTPYGLPKIADFGIAKWIADDSGHTKYGDVLGTATYMAPEQAAGNPRQIGPPTDIYSMGVLLYEMLTGRVPLQGITTLETLALVRGEDPVPPRRLQPHIPRDLETICLKCLEKDPSARYRSAADLADDLRRFLNHEPIHARPVTFWERGLKWARRRPAVAALSLALVLVGILGVAGVTWQWRQAERLAAKEATLRGRAEENERKIERLSGSMMLDRAATLCESGDVRHGLLWMVDALDAARRAADEDLDRVARLNLAAWMPFLLPEAVECSPSAVTAATFHQDGKMLLTGGAEGQVYRWEVLTGKQVGKPLLHDGPLHSLAYSPDGKYIVTGAAKTNGEGQARLWNSSTGEPLSPPVAHEQPVRFVSFCDGGRKFLTVTASEGRLWDLADPKPIGAVMKHEPMFLDPAGHPRPMTAVVSPDGRLIATGGSDLRVQLWNARTGEAVGEPLEATHAVVALVFSPDSRILLAGAVDGGVRMWDATTGTRRGESLKMRGSVHAVAFSPDGQLAAAAGAVGDPHLEPAGEVQLCQVETGQNLGAALAHPRPVRTLAFSPGGRLLLTGCDDGHARFFLTATGAPLGQPLEHGAPVTAVAFSPDGAAAMTATSAGNRNAHVRLWRAAREEAFGRPFVLPGELSHLAFGDDTANLLAGNRRGLNRRWNIQGDVSRHPPRPQDEADAARDMGRPSRDRESGEASILSVTSPDGSCVLAIDADGHARLRDEATGKAIGPRLGASSVCCLAVSSDNAYLAAGAQEGKIALWKRWGPVEGSAEQIRLAIELLAGMQLVSHESFQRLSASEIEQRRRRLQQELRD